MVDVSSSSNTNATVAATHEVPRIRRLDASIKRLEEIADIYDNQVRLFSQRIRARGGSPDDWVRLKQEIAGAWKTRYARLVSSRLIDDYSEERDQQETEREWTEFVERLLGNLPDGSRNAERAIYAMDAIAHGDGALMAELKLIIEEEPPFEEREVGATTETTQTVNVVVETTNVIESPEEAPTLEELLIETSGQPYILFDIVDEFGRKLNDPETKENNPNSAQRLVRDCDGIVLARPAAHRVTTSVDTRDMDDLFRTIEVSRGAARAVRAGPSRHSPESWNATDARSAGELEDAAFRPPNEPRTPAATIRSSGTSGREYATRGRLETLASGHRRLVSLNTTGVQTGTQGPGRQSTQRGPRTEPPSVFDEPRPRAPDLVDDWSESQRQWARMLASSDGLPFSESKALEKEARAKLVETGKRSLLIDLLSFPAKDTISDQMKQERTDLVCNAWLASLVDASAVSSSKSAAETKPLSSA